MQSCVHVSFHPYLTPRYVAKVIEVEEGDQEVLVHFEKWNSRYDEYIKINSGRLRSKHPSKVELFEKDQDISKKVRRTLRLMQCTCDLHVIVVFGSQLT